MTGAASTTSPAAAWFGIGGWTVAVAIAAWHFRTGLFRLLGAGLDAVLDGADMLARLGTPDDADDAIDDLLAPDEVTMATAWPTDVAPAPFLGMPAPFVLGLPESTFGGITTAPLGPDPWRRQLEHVPHDGGPWHEPPHRYAAPVGRS